MEHITPYGNETESLEFGDLTIENRLDKVTLYGGLDLTKDQAGLAYARQLKAILDAVVQTLEAEKSLPAVLPPKPRGKVSNPFA